ncbi:MAG: hypothetical protein DRJ43_00305, partial [Thermoprotei archaeon]
AYPPSHCGLKAFITTRVGDVFMLAGMLLLAVTAGTLSFTELPRVEVRHVHPILLSSLLLIYVGAIGKSAQLPLMEWLPDAMAGPTSVSALIHAATMVKAGVYLTARLVLVSLAWSEHMDVTPFFEYVMWTGVLTAFISALQAMVSTELKRTLAYSTVSQLGYMMAALGAASANPQLSIASAVFHMISHAVFKASLFLSAGAVIHAVESRFYRHFGGLGRYMRITMVAMVLASMSLAGVPPFSGFWSKDLVLSSLMGASSAAFILALLTASLTAFYTTRMLGLTFLGEESENVKEKRHELHEADLTMLAPYLILAIASLLLGLAAPSVEHFFIHMMHVHGVEEHEGGSVLIPLLSIVALVAGAAPASLMYVKRSISPPRGGVAEVIRGLLVRRLYINALYYRVFVNSTLKFGHSTWVLDKLLDKIYSVYLVRLVMRLGRLAREAESGIDATIYRVSSAAMGLAEAVRKMNTGVLNYNIVMWLLGGLLVILLAMLSSLGW